MTNKTSEYASLLDLKVIEFLSEMFIEFVSKNAAL